MEKLFIAQCYGILWVGGCYLKVLALLCTKLLEPELLNPKPYLDEAPGGAGGWLDPDLPLPGARGEGPLHLRPHPPAWGPSVSCN